VTGASILRNADCVMRKVVKGQFAENQVRNVPQITRYWFSASEKFLISADHKTTVRSHCATDVQPMHIIVRHPWALSLLLAHLCWSPQSLILSVFHSLPVSSTQFSKNLLFLHSSRNPP